MKIDIELLFLILCLIPAPLIFLILYIKLLIIDIKELKRNKSNERINWRLEKQRIILRFNYFAGITFADIIFSLMRNEDREKENESKGENKWT